MKHQNALIRCFTTTQNTFHNPRPRFGLRRTAVAALMLELACSVTHAGITTRASVDSAEREGQGGSYGGSISADGRYVVFASAASTLVPLDTNLAIDVFLRDRVAGVTKRISTSNSGEQGDGGSGGGPAMGNGPAISADGRYVAYGSMATNLVTGDTNNTADIFLYDRVARTTTRVSIGSGGEQANGPSWEDSISGDGRYVAFTSSASNLVANDTNLADDVFVHDRLTGVTKRVSVDGANHQANHGAHSPSISADGRYVAFASYASNLVDGDTNNATDVFVRDLAQGVTTRVNHTYDGGQDGWGAGSPSISADGRYVSFLTGSPNIVQNDTNDQIDVFVVDRDSDITTRVNVSSSGAQANGESGAPAVLSANGRYVAFASGASNLVAGDTNDRADVFVRDRTTGRTTRVSLSSNNSQAIWGGSHAPAISADGRYVVFVSASMTLVPGDTNIGQGPSGLDVFVRDRFANLAEGPHGAATCNDGVDNDLDGYVDSTDTDCALPPAPLTCGGSRVTIVGTNHGDLIRSTPSFDVIRGLGGDDVIYSDGVGDVLCGDDGADTLVGGAYDDVLFGGRGADVLKGGSGNDTLNGGAGVDTCDGQAGNDTHQGGCETLRNIP